ncbi:MAG: hypothetical protein LAT62_09840 [Natronospirillum sp.]|uniref:hypothetical protein n=1 Tax=Natronospirillum sp. TaxID=2812955 RepID=UPI0025E743DF|nr:hypothetical protein [Natronospirillum sp.]MCH8552226.1 hypothetical protein [Natronospirillum sp.]
MKKTLMAAALVAFAPAVQAAPFIDFEVGGGLTFPSLNDGGTGSGDDRVSFTDSGGDVQLDLEANNGFYLGGRLGLPIVPDIKLRYERLTFENSNFEETFEAFGETYQADGEIFLDMSYIDTVFFYGLPDLVPGVDYFVDLGVNLRWLLGGFEAEIDGGDSESFDFPGIPLPAAHIAAGATIPTVDVELSGELNILPLSGLSHRDWNVKARWFAPLPVDFVARVGVEAGYRSWTVDIDGEDAGLIDDDDFQLDFETSGFFVGTAITF